jgi:hypothetical protein
MNKSYILKKEVNGVTMYFKGKLHDKINETTTDINSAFVFTSSRTALNYNYMHLQGDYTVVDFETELENIKQHE